MSACDAAGSGAATKEDERCTALSEGVKISWNDILTDERHAIPSLQSITKSILRESIGSFESMSSFHSDDVEKLIALSEGDYVAPAYLPWFAQRIRTKGELSADAVEAQSKRQCVAGQATLVQADCADENATTTIVDTAGANYVHRDATCTPSDQCAAHSECLYLCGANVSRPATCSPQEDDTSCDRCAEINTPARVVAAPGDHALRDRCSPTDSRAAVSAAGVSRYAREEMGRAFRERHFCITDDVVFANHGAFGGAIAGGLAIKHAYETLMERESVAFVDRQLLPLLVHSVRALSHFLGADPRQVALSLNATHALNSAIQLIERGDVVAYLDTEYLSVYKMMYFRCQQVGATLHEMELNRYLRDDAVLGDDDALTAVIVAQLPTGCTVCVLDCITSTTAMALPLFTTLIPALRARGVRTILVDGAHATLQLDLQLSALPPACQPTVLVGNLHKWFSAPKSAGFLWVRAEDVSRVHAVVVSHGAGNGFLSEFIWDGTRDYGAALCIPALVAFWHAQDCARVRAYCSSLLEQAAAMLTRAFHSRRVARRAPFMSLVELPGALQDPALTVKFIQDMLYKYYKLELPVKCIDGVFYVRVSAFVYNVPSDYVYLRNAVLSLCESWKLTRAEVVRLSESNK